MVCVKIKHGPEGLRERDIQQSNATKALSQNFGTAKHFISNNLDWGSKSTKYTDRKYEYVGNLAKI